MSKTKCLTLGCTRNYDAPVLWKCSFKTKPCALTRIRWDVRSKRGDFLQRWMFGSLRGVALAVERGAHTRNISKPEPALWKQRQLWEPNIIPSEHVQVAQIQSQVGKRGQHFDRSAGEEAAAMRRGGQPGIEPGRRQWERGESGDRVGPAALLGAFAGRRGTVEGADCFHVSGVPSEG